MVMNAVLKHIPDVGAAFSEVARILKPGGCFVGYVAFMECFHAISHLHLSFKALEYYSTVNGMKLSKEEASDLSQLYFQIECLRRSNGFGYVIRKN